MSCLFQMKSSKANVNFALRKHLQLDQPCFWCSKASSGFCYHLVVHRVRSFRAGAGCPCLRVIHCGGFRCGNKGKGWICWTDSRATSTMLLPHLWKFCCACLGRAERAAAGNHMLELPREALVLSLDVALTTCQKPGEKAGRALWLWECQPLPTLSMFIW